MKLICFLLASFSLFAGDLLEQLAFGKDALYQDILINGEAIYHGGHHCQERYDAIKPILDQYDRPFTVVDIGANNGYFSLRIAEDYDATAVMIDFTDRLEKICTLNTNLDNIIYLKKQLCTEDLKLLNQKEHFDVLIMFHVLHHIQSPDNWEDFLVELFKLADHVIIQTPPENDGFVPDKPTIPAIAKRLLADPRGKLIGSFPRQSKTIKDHMLHFAFEPKKGGSKRKGISLASFKKLHGKYPTPAIINQEREKLPFYKRYFKEAITVEGTKLK